MICLSFDTDHLDAERMGEFVAEVRIPGSGTFFCTEVYPSLEPTAHEVCPHPTLDPGEDWTRVLDEARSQFPEAQGFRAHSCLHSHMLAIELSQRGYRYASAHGAPHGSGTTPYREAWGLWHLPIYYLDNLDFSFARFWPQTTRRPFARELLDAAVDGDGIYVFDFHPIHLLLNSTSAEEYFSRRDQFLDGASLDQIRCEGYGARSYYEDLLEMMDAKGLVSTSMNDAVDQMVERSRKSSVPG